MLTVSPFLYTCLIKYNTRYRSYSGGQNLVEEALYRQYECRWLLGHCCADILTGNRIWRFEASNTARNQVRVVLGSFWLIWSERDLEQFQTWRVNIWNMTWGSRNWCWGPSFVNSRLGQVPRWLIFFGPCEAGNRGGSYDCGGRLHNQRSCTWLWTTHTRVM